MALMIHWALLSFLLWDISDGKVTPSLKDNTDSSCDSGLSASTICLSCAEVESRKCQAQIDAANADCGSTDTETTLKAARLGKALCDTCHRNFAQLDTDACFDLYMGEAVLVYAFNNLTTGYYADSPCLSDDELDAATDPDAEASQKDAAASIAYANIRNMMKKQMRNVKTNVEKTHDGLLDDLDAAFSSCFADYESSTRDSCDHEGFSVCVLEAVAKNYDDYVEYQDYDGDTLPWTCQGIFNLGDPETDSVGRLPCLEYELTLDENYTANWDHVGEFIGQLSFDWDSHCSDATTTYATTLYVSKSGGIDSLDGHCSSCATRLMQTQKAEKCEWIQRHWSAFASEELGFSFDEMVKNVGTIPWDSEGLIKDYLAWRTSIGEWIHRFGAEDMACLMDNFPNVEMSRGKKGTSGPCANEANFAQSVWYHAWTTCDF